MNAYGEILIKPCPEIADAGNRLDFKIPDSDRFKLDLAQLLEGTHNEKLRFVSFILRSVGDHTSSNVSFDCFERIILKRCRQWLEEQIQLTIIRIRMDTRQVVLNDVEDPRCKHDKYNRSQAATLRNSLYRNF